MVIRVIGMWFASSIVVTPVIAMLLKHHVRLAQPAYVRPVDNRSLMR